MSVPWPGSMRGSQVKSPLLLLLLLLFFLLLLLKAGTVLCQDDEEDGEDADASKVDEDVSGGDPADGDTPASDDPEIIPVMDPPRTNEEFNEVDGEGGSGGTDPPPEDQTDTSIILNNEESLSATIILIPVGLVVLIIAMIVGGIFISRRCNTKASKRELKVEDPYLDGSAKEKVPMPMFEEDVPSVLELEMEELDEWMQQDGEATKESMQT